jgi:hypothetical protein
VNGKQSRHVLKKNLLKLYFDIIFSHVTEVPEAIFSHVFRSGEREAVSPRAQEELTEAIISHMFRCGKWEAVQVVTEAIFSHVFRPSEREAVSLRRPEVHRTPPTHLQHQVRHQVPPQIYSKPKAHVKASVSLDNSQHIRYRRTSEGSLLTLWLSASLPLFQISIFVFHSFLW